MDVVHDLNKYPYPFEDNQFERIILSHVAEHIEDLVSFMEEIYRIAKPDAILEIHSPHYSSCNAYIDPTHLHYFSLLTFDFFCGDTKHGYIVTSKFTIVKRDVEFWPLHDKLKWVPYNWLGPRWLARNHIVLYERFFAFIFPMKEFLVHLKVIK